MRAFIPTTFAVLAEDAGWVPLPLGRGRLSVFWSSARARGSGTARAGQARPSWMRSESFMCCPASAARGVIGLYGTTPATLTREW